MAGSVLVEIDVFWQSKERSGSAGSDLVVQAMFCHFKTVCNNPRRALSVKTMFWQSRQRS